MAEDSRIGYRPHLDGVRAVAVLSVLLFHLGVSQAQGGFIGVDVFFVLSGYLITAIIYSDLAAGKFSFGDFYLRRARRILPALLTVIALTLAASFLLLGPAHLESAARSAVYAVFCASNINFWLDAGYFDTGKFFKPLLHTWSLGVEEQFYIVWPALLALLFAIGKRALVVIGIVAIFAASLAAELWAQTSFPDATFYLSPFRAWQFVAGGLIAAFEYGVAGGGKKRAALGWFGAAITVLGLAAVVASAALIEPENYPGWLALAPTAGAALLVLGGDNPLSRLILANPLSRFLGRISYALYLTHWPIVVFTRYIVGGPLDAPLMAFAAGLSLTTAVLLHYAIEVPLRKPWSTGGRWDKVAVPAGIAAAALALTAPAALMWTQAGWTWRLPAAAAAHAQNTRNWLPAHCVARRAGALGRRCFFGRARAQPDFILIGDSHARALAEGLDPVLFAHDSTGLLLHRPGTLPFVGAVTYDRRNPLPTFDAAYAYINTAQARVIVVHARYALYWEGRYPNIRRRRSIGTARGLPRNLAESHANFRSTLRETLRSLSQSGARIVLVGAVPFQGVNLAQCIARPTYVVSLDHWTGACNALSREAALAQTRTVNMVLRQEAAASGALFIDPADVLCADVRAVCLRSYHDRLVYSDDDHLSLTGATLLAEEIWRRLDAAAVAAPTPAQATPG